MRQRTFGMLFALGLVFGLACGAVAPAKEAKAAHGGGARCYKCVGMGQCARSGVGGLDCTVDCVENLCFCIEWGLCEEWDNQY
jgi:hypothetical protein